MKRTTLQFALHKVGIGWMFALLTINFNRVTIGDLGITALLVTAIIGVFPFFAPIQPSFRLLADRFPLFGYRRTPYLLLGMLVASLVFPALPVVALGLSRGAPGALMAGFGLMVVFGLAIALIANTFLDLITEVTVERSRGGVFAVAWIAQTASIMVAASVMQALMPVYTPGAMQLLYNLTPLIVGALALLGVLGVEPRLSRDQLALQLPARAASDTPLAALSVLGANRPARGFFAFVLLALMGIFLQDAILEVFGGEVFGMTPGETASFQQVWNGGVLVAMLAANGALGALAARVTHERLARVRRVLVHVGGLGTALSLGWLSLIALTGRSDQLYAALVLMGVSTGAFTAVAVTMMAEMTVEGASGRYLGLWSMAQAFATGLSFVGAGALHTALIGSGVLTTRLGYAWIFGVEAALMLVALLILRRVSVEQFRAAEHAALVRVAAPASGG